MGDADDDTTSDGDVSDDGLGFDITQGSAELS